MGVFSKFTASTLLTRLFLIFFSVLTGIITARFLGPEGRGYFALLLLIPSLAYSMGKFGINTAVNYHYGRTLNPSYIVNSLYLTIGLSIIATIGMTLFVYLTQNTIFTGLRIEILLAMCGLLFLIFLHNQTLSSVQALYKIYHYNTLQAIDPLANFGLLLLFLLIFKMNLIGAISAWFLSKVFSLMYGFYLLRREGNVTNFEWNSGLQKDLLTYGSRVHIGVIFKSLTTRIDLFVVAYFVEPAEVGFLAIATTLAEAILWLPSSVQEVLTPRLMRGSKTNANYVPVIVQAVFISALAASALLIGFGKNLTILLYGRDFEPSYPLLVFLLPGVVFYSITKIISTTLLARNNPIWVSFYTALTIFVLLITDVYYLPKLGVIGAAYGYSLAYFVGALAAVWIYCFQSNVSFGTLLIPSKENIKILMTAFYKILSNTKLKTFTRG